MKGYGAFYAFSPASIHGSYNVTSTVMWYDISDLLFPIVQVQQIAEYMSYRKLPTMTREKVLKYFDHRYKGKFFDERAILGEISSPLRNVGLPSPPGFNRW